MTSDRQFFSGGSLTQAVNQAAQHFELDPSQINYRVVEKRHGFLKVRRKVMIEVDGADPGKAPTDPSPADVAGRAPEERSAEVDEARPGVDGAQARESEDVPGASAEPEPGSPEPRLADGGGGREGAALIDLPEAPVPVTSRYQPAEGDEARAAAEALEQILALASLDLESKILQGEEELQIELWGSDQDILLRDRGRLLLAVQHLLPRVVRGRLGRSVPCRVDSDDFHMIREERLRDMAQRAADEVRNRRRPKTLEPMSPDERRIVHLTLTDYPGVETESQGSGLFKRVMVRPERGESRGPGRYNR